jgi:AraC family transcriptional activator of pobA
MREHRHTYYEVMLIARDGGNQLIDFKNYSSYDFSCYITCPQQIHLMNRNDSAGVILKFSDEIIQAPELLVALKQLQFYENAAIVFENDAHAFTELKALLNLLEGQARKSDLSGRLAVSHLLHAFVALMLPYHQNKESADLAADRKLMLDFFELLEMNYKANRNVQYFINALGSTEKKLGAATKKYTGFSPLQVMCCRLPIFSTSQK